MTTFIPDDDDSPKWFDRPCFENDIIGELGHRFMCEVKDTRSKYRTFWDIYSDTLPFKGNVEHDVKPFRLK